jgi:hypothetical protein
MEIIRSSAKQVRCYDKPTAAAAPLILKAAAHQTACVTCTGSRGATARVLGNDPEIVCSYVRAVIN